MPNFDKDEFLKFLAGKMQGNTMHKLAEQHIDIVQILEEKIEAGELDSHQTDGLIEDMMSEMEGEGDEAMDFIQSLRSDIDSLEAEVRTERDKKNKAVAEVEKYRKGIEALLVKLHTDLTSADDMTLTMDQVAKDLKALIDYEPSAVAKAA